MIFNGGSKRAVTQIAEAIAQTWNRPGIAGPLSVRRIIMN